MLFVFGKKRSFGPRYLKTRVLANVRLTSPRFRLKKRKVQLLITRNRGGFRGGGGEAAAAPALSSSDIFFCQNIQCFYHFVSRLLELFIFLAKV